MALARAAATGSGAGPRVASRVHGPRRRRGRARSSRRALERGGGWLVPLEAEELLTAFGIPLAPARVAPRRRPAAAAPREIGFPVALKAVGPAILHKTEVGGVRLGLADEAAVIAGLPRAAERLGTDDGASRPGDGPGRRRGDRRRRRRDPTFGPLVIYGSGGTLVELLADVAFRLHPLTDVDAAAMLDEVRGTALLRGLPGRAPLDEAALRDLLLRLSALVEACPEVHEMDLNPVKVLASGVRWWTRGSEWSAAGVPPSRRIAY